MAGITHTAFRTLVAELGGPGLCVSEMLSARSLPNEDPFRSPYLKRSGRDRPLAYQLLVARVEEVAPAVEVLHALGADAVDLNLGCPAPQARRRGAGGWLAGAPEVLRPVLAEARKRTALPLTAKIRLGERLDEVSLRSLVAILEDGGVDLITVHARLRSEPYGRKPRWEWIGKVKSWVTIPVVGNGGIFSVADAERCLRVSGCDGLMVGRGAVVRPWLARDVAREVFGEPLPPEVPSRREVFLKFAELLEEHLPEERRLGRLKGFTHYFSQTYIFGHGLASAVQASRSPQEARQRAEEFFGADERARLPETGT